MSETKPPSSSVIPSDTSNTVPNPGSDEALDRGCECAVLDNAHGRGYRGQKGVFVITERCPLHGSPEHRKTQEATDAD